MASAKTVVGDITTETENEFNERINTTLMNGFAMMGISLGLKLGLFDVMAATDRAMTSSEVAEKSDCKERYVREWLHQMVMCDVVHVDRTGKNFTLPSHRRKALAGDTNMTSFMASVYPYLLANHGTIVDSFTKDGPNGMPDSLGYPVVVEFAKSNVHKHILKESADFGKEVAPGLKEKLEVGIRVCDIGCGTGTMLIHLAKQFPKSHFVGFEISPELVEICSKKKSSENVSNVEVILQDVTELPDSWSGAFDWIYLRDVLHDIPYVGKALSAIHRSLKADGILSVTEIGLSSNPYKSYKDGHQKVLGQMMYGISMYYCLPISMYYPGSDAMGTAPGIENLCLMIEAAGFELIVEPKHFGAFNVHLVFKRRC